MSENESGDGNRWEGLVSSETIQCLNASKQAVVVSHFSVNLVPGLCQTAAYTRALMEGAFGIADGDVERYVALRHEYREAVRRPSIAVRVLLDESAVRREVGSPDTMRGQIEELIRLDVSDGAELRLVPFSAGAHVGLRGPFVHLQLQDGAGDLVYREIDGLDELRRDPASSRFLEYFDLLWAQAKRGSELHELLRGLW